MNSLFEDLRDGLIEAIEIERGNLKGRTAVLAITPVKRYSGVEIRNVRMNAHLTQKAFAEFMGVSQKTVEAWESGKANPVGAACRLMSMLQDNAVESFPFVIK